MISLVGLAAVSEPHNTSPGPDWLSSSDGLALLGAGPGSRHPPLRLVGRGDGFVAARWGRLTVASCYVSPNAARAVFDDFLRSLWTCVQGCAGGPLVIMGDFNAKAVAWGNRGTDVRGRILADWASGLDLRVLNQGGAYTCVRMGGGSVVDVTFANAAAGQHITSWRVRIEVESLSDHRYLTMEYGVGEGPCRRRRSGWRLASLREDALVEALTLLLWGTPLVNCGTPSEMADSLGHILERACDAAMPRIVEGPRKRASYWWGEDLARLRTASMELRSITRHLKKQ